jgi:G3E family GTPase
MRAMTAIPLTVIGGFLGAGKTTLVNHLLRSATTRIAVLVNDFGAVNVDAALITARDGTTMALANGCACCALGDDLENALAMLAGRDPAPEHIIVEASGISDPWRIAQIALAEPRLALEPLVVLADAAALPDQLADKWVASTVTRQLAFADLVVLNKCDPGQDTTAAEAAIARIRPQARLLRVRQGAVALDALRFPVPASPRHSRLQADAAHGFASWFWRCHAVLDRDRLRAVLHDLPPSVLRVKGFCRMGDPPQPYLLQYAAERWAFTEAQAGAQDGFVVIGTPDMPDDAALAALFAQALPPSTACPPSTTCSADAAAATISASSGARR